MNTTADIDKLLTDAAEQIKREAYASGWRDCLAAVNKAVSGMAEGVILGGIPEIPRTKKESEAPEVTVGSTPHFVLRAIRDVPGLSSTQVVDAVHEAGHKAAAASIRTTIFRLKDRKLLVARHRKWYPT